MPVPSLSRLDGGNLMSGSSPPVTPAAPGTATDEIPLRPRSARLAPRPVRMLARPEAPPAGTLAQLAGQGTWLVATPKRRVFPGRPEQVAVARQFVARVLDGCPVADDAQLCTSELAANAIQHTRSGLGGQFQVVVWRGRTSACVAVLDDGSHSAPALARDAFGTLAECGHGLRTVQALATWWGHHAYQDGPTRGTAVCFRLDWAETP
jgi:anti-sigma regulatory factor (Ser/Thr protein kinase)